MKKIISIALCVALLAGTLALGLSGNPFVMTASADSSDISNAVSPEGPLPSGFENASDPYNLAGTTDTKQIAAMNEIMFTLNEADSSSDGNIQNRIGDNLKPGEIDGTNDALSFDDNNPYFESTTGYNNTIKNVYFMRSTALDSDGDGQRESVVYVGWKEDKHIYTWVTNAKTKQTSSLLDLGTAANGIYQLFYKDSAYREESAYQSMNFFSLTAGDFYGSGKEIVLAALPFGTGKKVETRIVELSVSGTTITQDYKGYYTYLNQFFFKTDETNISNSGDYEDLLSTQITSGDFNGDGIDDLAVLSYTNNISDTYDGEDWKDLYTPYLAIGYGRKTQGLTDSPKHTAWVEKYDKNDGDDTYYDIPVAGNIIGADIDNDGKDEIVLSGYAGQVYGDAHLIGDGHDYEMLDSARTASKLIFATYDVESGISNKSWERKAGNGWTSVTSTDVSGVWLGNSPSSDWCWQPMGLGKAKIDGIGTADYVFISGSMYKFSNGNLNSQYTPDYFSSSDTTNDSSQISVSFITSTANGVFDGNLNTKEQIAFVVGLKEASLKYIHYLVGVIGKKETTSGTMDWYCNDIEDAKTYRSKWHYANINSVDCDNDIVKVKYNSKSYGWSDPDVVGVLQAAPYFGELGSFDDFNDGATTIEFSTSYESEYAESCSQSLGVGGMFEVDAEVFEMEIKAGYSGAWSQTTFSTHEQSQGVHLTTGPNNMVIVKRTPVYDFSYDIWDAENNTWVTDGYHINIVKESTYYTFSVDQYNTFARLYNQQMSRVYNNNYKKIKEITNENAPYLYGNEGNPYAYIEGTIGSTALDLGHIGGSQGISYEEAYGSGSSSSEENGFSFEMSACGGSEHVKFGLYMNTEFMWGYETTNTVVSGTATEGEVACLNDEDIADAIGSPESLVAQYGFKWSFGSWNIDLVDGENVPVYGYYLTNITSPPPRVTDLTYEVTNGGKDLSFTWSEPETKGSTEIAGYYLYKSVEGREFTKVTDELITDTSFTLTPELYDRTKSIEFAVTSAIAHEYPTGEPYYSEGLFSNHCRFNGDLNGKSAYEIACDEGFEGTLEEWLESLKGAHVTKVEKTGTNGLVDTYTVTFSDGTTTFFTVTNGENGKTAYEIAQSNGYTGTVEQWLTLIGADCASGHDFVEFTMPASCGRPGFTLKVCSKCGSSEITSTDALEHNYIQTVVAPTHDTCGYTRYVCDNCGDTYCDNLTAITAHTYTEKVVEPTCIESGYTEKTCTECGIVIRTDIVPANGHSYTGTVTEPTCSHFGYTTYKCANCDSEYVSDVTPTVAHNFTSKVIKNTCCSEGYTIKYCADCGFSVIEDETDAKGHKFEVTNVFAPTCSTTGYSIYTCSECGVNYIDDITETTAHTPGEWVCEDPATGRYVKRCENCYKLLDTKTVSIVGGNGDGEGEGSGGSNSLNPNIDENGVLNIGYQKTEKVTLKADGIDTSTVVYTSSDPKVATVDEDGNITAVGPGDAVITASIPGTAITTSVPVNVKLTWWQKIHYILNTSALFRIIFVIFKIPAFDGLPL